MSDYIVSGPGTEGKTATSAGHGCAIAQSLAGKAQDDATWYVRRASDGTVEYQVAATGGVIYTTPVNGPEPRKRTAATTTTLERTVS